MRTGRAVPAHEARPWLGRGAALVIDAVNLAPYLSRRFYLALREFCADEGLGPRFLVVGGTEPGFALRAPKGWPPAVVAPSTASSRRAAPARLRVEPPDPTLASRKEVRVELALAEEQGEP